MIPISLCGKNFLSFEDVEYDFVSRPLLIVGKNKTDKGQKSNGAGKTALQNIIEYCIYGSVSRKTNDKKLVRRGQKSSEIGFTIHCPIRRETLSIKRQLFSKGSSKLNISINGDESSFSTVKDGNDIILKWFGITREDLQNYFIINKDRYKSFFDASEREKIELISRFSNADIISGVENYVDDDIKKQQLVIDELTSKKDRVLGKIEALKEELDKEVGRDLKEERKTSINSFREQIEVGDESDEEDAKEISKLQNSLSALNNSLIKAQSDLDVVIKNRDKFSSISYSKKKDEINSRIDGLNINKKKISRSVAEYEKVNRELNEILTDIEKNLAGEIKCPKCSHKFPVSDPNVSIIEEKEEKIIVDKEIVKIKEQLLTLEKSIDDKNSKIFNLEKELNSIHKKELDQEGDLDKLRESVTSFKESVSKIESDIVDKKGSISTLKKAMEARQKVKDDILAHIEKIKKEELKNPRIDELKTSIKDVEADLEKFDKDISEEENKLASIKEWFFNMKKFHQHLALKSLKVIEGHINTNLNSLNSDLQVLLEGFKMKSDGKITEKITPYVIDNGTEEDFGNYSGGERARMEFAVILAVQSMVNMTHPYGGLQFLSIDEVMERVDDDGLGFMMKSLSNIEMPIWVTTHVSDDKVFSDILKIEKVNGISRIVN